MPREDDALRCEDGERRVRAMAVDDIPRVLEIERRSFASPWSERAFRSEITRNISADYIVVTCAGEILGYAGMWLFLMEAHVTNIAVDPDHRGRGLGAHLLLALMARALAHGLRRMTLEVRVSNALARSFYGRYGFEEVKIKPGYYTDTGEDAVLMCCADIGLVLRRKGE